MYAADCATPLAGATIEVWQTTAAGEYGPRQAGGEERCCYLAAALRTDAAGLLTELVFEGDPYLGPDPPGEVVAPVPVEGADPPAFQARFDIVLRTR